MAKEVDLIGQRHGRLVCVEYLGLQKRNDGRNNKIWRCICDCGREKIVTSHQFCKIKSCGCLRCETAHNKFYKGRDRHIYGILFQMRKRCYNPDFKYYYNYGGRGITICDEWMGNDGIENFEQWALSHGYKKGLTIDRIDNDKGYSPDNCRWVDMKTQSNNKRNNLYLEMNGKTQTLSQWCEEYGVPYGRVEARITKMGWNLEEALFTPRYKGGKIKNGRNSNSENRTETGHHGFFVK